MTQSGTKIILYHGARLISLLRDDVPSIPYPNHWDLPGGGIEADEDAKDAILRETAEEIGLHIAPATVTWTRAYSKANGFTSTFYAAPVTAAQIAAITLGNEGQAWSLMPIATFCSHPQAVPHFRTRVRDYLTDARKTKTEA
ncbi:NUDIX hydrolase [Pseudooctadecabacter jejudonensis]|uniref:Nudix hydrolase domain-containing protein n=1 Tax=Pseudooctadecabacter jejudonensis TaxID=1391910 RepID=A0A1Y5RR38_9RHOB|nr:NUDIX hydrolase [Pseudooctadecabacter jejudonensis]SLN20692.1 hypothetical protein PSJ8397_00781 [Pseudooctadecabacter jejudonensis]